MRNYLVTSAVYLWTFLLLNESLSNNLRCNFVLINKTPLNWSINSKVKNFLLYTLKLQVKMQRNSSKAKDKMSQWCNMTKHSTKFICIMFLAKYVIEKFKLLVELKIAMLHITCSLIMLKLHNRWTF